MGKQSFRFTEKSNINIKKIYFLKFVRYRSSKAGRILKTLKYRF